MISTELHYYWTRAIIFYALITVLCTVSMVVYEVMAREDVIPVDHTFSSILTLFITALTVITSSLIAYSHYKWGDYHCNLPDILIAAIVCAIMSTGLYLLMTQGALGIIILNPFVGWISSILDGILVRPAFAAISTFVSLLFVMWLIFPGLFCRKGHTTP